MFGAVMFAFLFYITVKGDLAKWLGLLGLGAAAPIAAPIAAPDLRVVGGTDYNRAH